MTEFKVQINDEGLTLFKFLKKSFSTTPLSVIYKWVRVGAIKVNEKKVKDLKILLKAGDLVKVYDRNQPQTRSQFKYVKNPNLKIVYEDENLLIVDKPANLEVHSPVNLALDDLVKSYLVNQGEYHPDEENTFVISHVHRLDKLTSGLIIYAKNKVSLNILTTCVKDHETLEKYYLLKVDAKTRDQDFLSEGWIEYDPTKQLAVFSEKEKAGYKKVATAFKFVEEQVDANVWEAQLLTGRKHQIRATLAYYQMPILNDFRYGGRKLNSEKMIYLTAYKLIFKKIPAPLNYLDGQIITLKLNNW